MWILWLSLSAVLWGGMLVLPPQEAINRRPPRVPGGVWCFLRGDLTVGSTVLIGLSLVGAGWWCVAMGLRVGDVTRSVLVLSIGGLVLVALFNAGRRATLSLWARMALAGLQGAGGVIFILTGLELAGFSLP